MTCRRQWFFDNLLSADPFVITLVFYWIQTFVMGAFHCVFFVQLAILLVAAALMEIDFIQGHPKKSENTDYMVPTKGNLKKRSPDEDEMDVVDRADHITQFLADMFVNTDDEITILQAAEPEENFFPSEVEDTFFNFLSRQANNQHRVERPSDDLTR